MFDLLSEVKENILKEVMAALGHKVQELARQMEMRISICLDLSFEVYLPLERNMFS